MEQKLTSAREALMRKIRTQQKKGMSLRWLMNNVSPGLEEKYEIYKLDEKNVPRSPKDAAREHKLEGESYFLQAHELLNKVLPEERMTEKQHRDWLFSSDRGDTFFHVAVDLSGTVAGASVTTYVRKVNLALFNLIAVDPQFRQQGVARKLVKHRIWSADEASKNAGKGGIDYMATEIARLDGREKDNLMQHKIRPKYHENISQVKAVVSPEPECAILGPTNYMFAIRQIRNEEAKTMPARVFARLIYWYYVDYTKWNKLQLNFTQGTDYLAKILNKIAMHGGITGKIIRDEKLKVLNRIPKNLNLELRELSKL